MRIDHVVHIATLLLAAGHLAACSSMPQRSTTARFNWHTKESSRPMARAGGIARIEVTEVNRLCFEYRVNATQIAATNSNWKSLLSALGTAADQTGDVPEEAGTGIQSFDTQFQQAFGFSPLSPFASARGESVATLTRSLNADARKILEFARTVCPDRGAGPRPSALKMEWDGIRPGVTDLRDRLARLRTLKDGAYDAVAQWFDLSADTLTADEQLLIATFRMRADSTLRAAESTEQLVNRALPVVTALDDALSNTTYADELWLNTDTERLDVLITATRQTDGEDTRSIEDRFSLPVFRMHRTFISAGILYSGVPVVEFARRNLPAEPDPDDDRTDTDGGQTGEQPEPDAQPETKVSFIPKESGKEVSVYPAVFLNVTLAEWPHWEVRPALTVTGGLTQRTVGGDAATEILLGGSISIIDQVVVSALLHHGRVQRLLIDQATNEAGLPASINDADVVGIRWISRLALSLSWRF